MFIPPKHLIILKDEMNKDFDNVYHVLDSLEKPKGIHNYIERIRKTYNLFLKINN